MQRLADLIGPYWPFGYIHRSPLVYKNTMQKNGFGWFIMIKFLVKDPVTLLSFKTIEVDC